MQHNMASKYTHARHTVSWYRMQVKQVSDRGFHGPTRVQPCATRATLEVFSKRETP